ncbi:MAG TPA: hypothetical protein VFK47_14380 [Ktedonobacteraceae bacterium]|jgi:hypothetical protein|nr:hypothetical protein [Ktedonobacteraceae bacterium]
MNDQPQPRQKIAAGSIFFITLACVSAVLALLSLCAPIWGYLFIWGDGWSGTPFELFLSNQFPAIGFVTGLLLCALSLVGLAVTRAKQRSSTSS